jgi:bacteriorhodopsin
MTRHQQQSTHFGKFCFFLSRSITQWLTHDLSAALLFHFSFLIIYDWITIMFQVSGRKKVIARLFSASIVLCVVLWTSYIILSLLQSNTNARWLWRSGRQSPHFHASCCLTFVLVDS